LLAAIILASSFCFGQTKKTIKLDAKLTKIESFGAKLKIATFIAYKGSEPIDTIVTQNGRLFFTMELGYVYRLEFRKSGYVSKHLIIDTRALPADFNRKSKIKIDVGLFKEHKGFDVSFLDKEPMGMASYNEIEKKITWNDAYTRYIVEKIINATLDYTDSKE